VANETPSSAACSNAAVSGRTRLWADHRERGEDGDGDNSDESGSVVGVAVVILSARSGIDPTTLNFGANSCVL
jgi:hypothetical protein